MNVFGNKASSGLVQPWSDIFAFGKEIRNFYESRGDTVISSPTEIATLLDGPEKVVRYGALTLSSTLTASLRCKGLTVICDSLTVNSGGNLHMTGRGCRVDRSDDPRYPFIDFRIPDKIGLASSVMSRKAALDLIKAKGLAPWDRGFWDVDGGMLGLSCSIAEIGAVQLLASSGCGAGGIPLGMGSGVIGAAGTNGGMGGGGTGASNTISTGAYYAARGGYGCPYSGGSGSGACFANSGYEGYTMEGAPLSSKYSGPGGRGGMLWHTQSYWMDSQLAGYGCGGAGNPGGTGGVGAQSNPGGDGCGGKLVIICHGNVTINSGGKIEANGVAGGSAGSNSCGGGGSGGGHLSIIHGGTYANNGTVQAAGGAGGPGNYGAGGAGGAGSVVTKTFAQMGWS